ncbi:MAG: enoyl-CoA hydratase/isomerase family protein [Deltaproteobacteria bacterium]|nr:enoyl-CoA hydratase/isomerase family protein [Deltaproteobacteria bacterium]
MSYETLLFEKDENIAIITFNRPDVLNAINQQVVSELDQALDAVAADPEIKALVLTGAGGKAFVAGADIKSMVSLTPVEAKRFAAAGQDVLFKLQFLHTPTIAAVNGFALGGGLEIAMSCDFIYASDRSKFGQPEINLGVIPGWGGTQRLTRLVGKPMAKELCLTGAVIKADEAKAIGLINKVFPADGLMTEVIKTAKLMASKGRVALRAIKHSIDRGFDMDVRNAMAYEVESFATCFSSEDQKEGMSAFLEKRPAVFKGTL